MLKIEEEISEKKLGQRILAMILIMVILVLVIIFLNIASQFLSIQIIPTNTQTHIRTTTQEPVYSPTPSSTKTLILTTSTQMPTVITKFIRETTYDALIQYPENVERDSYIVINVSIKVKRYLIRALEIRAYKSPISANESSIIMHIGLENQIYRNITQVKPPKINYTTSWCFHIPRDIDQPYLIIYIYPVLTDEKGEVRFFTVPIVISMKVRKIKLMSMYSTLMNTTSNDTYPLVIIQQCLKFEIDKTIYSVGESINIALVNTCNITIRLRPKDPWSIYTYDPINKSLKDLIFQPSTNALLELELKPGERISWIWDTVTLYYTIKPGNYSIALAPKITVKINEDEVVILGIKEIPRANFVIVPKERLK